MIPEPPDPHRASSLPGGRARPGEARKGRTLRAAALGLVALACAGPSLWASGASAQTARSDFAVANGTVNAAVASGGTLYLGGSFTRVGPATGSGVPVDADSGAVQAGFPVVSGQVSAVAPDGSGGWYIGGVFTAVGGQARANLAHVLSDLTVADWDPGANGMVRALAVSGGTVFAGGDFTSAGGQARAYVAALDAATGQARAWNPGANASVRALALGGGTLFAGGAFTTMGAMARNRLAALDTASGAVGAWNPGANGTVRALATAGGVVYAGGQFSNVGGLARANLAAIDAVTGAVTAWNPAANGQVAALLASGGVVYAGGDFLSAGGQARSRIAALDASTGQATSWNPVASSSVLALALSGGVVYAGGDFLTIGGQSRYRAAALDAVSGVVSPWDPSAYGTVSALGVSGNRVYLGGSFGAVGGLRRSNLAAVDIATGRPTGWDPSPSGQVLSLALGDAVVYVGGAFTAIGGLPRVGLAAVEEAEGTVTAWAPGVDGPVSALAVSGTTVYAGGAFSGAGGQARSNLAALDAVTGLATPWAPDPDGQVFALALQGGLVYVGGSFMACGGAYRSNIAAVDAASGAATAWAPGANGTVRAIAPMCGTIYVGGFFTLVGGHMRSYLAALDVTGGSATAWDPSANGPVYTVVLAGGAVYLGGVLSVVGGQARDRLASLDPATGLATAWNPDAGGTVRVVAVAGGALYAGGSFGTMGSAMLPNVAALPADASLACPSISLAPPPPPSGTVGAPYSWSLGAAGGTAPYCYALTGGRLPGGVTLNASTGTIAGVPAAAGVYGFAVSATDAFGCGGSATYTLEVVPAGVPANVAADADGLGITPTHPCVSVPFVLTRSDSTAARAASVTFQLDVAKLALCTPANPGASVHAGAWLAGFPGPVLQVRNNGGGSYTVDESILGTSCGATGGGVLFTVDLASAGGDGAGAIAVTAVSLRDCANAPLAVAPGPVDSLLIENTPISILPDSLPAGATGVAYRETLRTATGYAPFTFSLLSGALPPGLALSPGGVIAGTPAAPGAFAFTVGVADVYGCPGQRAYLVAIACSPLVVRPAALPGGVVGVAYVQTFSASGGTPPYAFAVSDGAPPQGLALSASGLLSGTPLAAGTSMFTVAATDSVGCAGSRAYVVTVFAAPPGSEVAADAGGLCITPTHPCVSVPFVLTRSDSTAARAASVTFQLDVARLTLCTPASPETSVHAGAWLAGFPGPVLQVRDNGGGSYTVDESILGMSCGATGGGVLFTVDLASAGGDGAGAIAVTAVSLRDCANQPIPVASGAPASITVESALPPAIADLAAARVVAPGDTISTTGIRLTWTALPADTVRLYRAPFGAYPLYDRDGPVAPPNPAAAPGPPWALVATGAASGLEDRPPVRGFWHYVALVTDACGAVSPPSAMTPGTLDYVLGDVSDGRTAGVGNDFVGAEDVSLLGVNYGCGKTEITARHVEYLDVGPTTDGSPTSRPTPDGTLDIEDLMILALSFHVAPGAGPEASPAGAVAAADTGGAAGEVFQVEAPALADAGRALTARVTLRGAGRLQGFSMRLAWDPSVVRPVAAQTGGFVEAQGGVVLSPAPGVVDAALLGARARGLKGEGEVATVTFEALRTGDPAIAIAGVVARDARNRPLGPDAVLRAALAEPPARSALLVPVPNPFAQRSELTFALAEPGDVELAVFSVDGRRVRTLASGRHAPGVHHVSWDGLDDDRRPVPPGVFYARLSAPGCRVTQRLVHLR